MDMEFLGRALATGTSEELNKILTQLPLTALQRAIEARKTRGTASELALSAEIEFEQRLKAYCDIGPMPVGEQVAITSEFWEKQGYRQPPYRPEHYERFTEVAENLPVHFRLLPTPLLSLEERLKLGWGGDARLLNDARSSYRTLLRDPETRLPSNNTTLMLQYRSVSGQYLSRQKYVQNLMSDQHESGRPYALEAAAGRVWLFPFVELSALSLVGGTALSKGHEQMSALAVPEVLLTVLHMRLAAGAVGPASGNLMYATNEVMGSLIARTGGRKIQMFTTVSYNAKEQRMCLGGATERPPDYALIRAQMVNGL